MNELRDEQNSRYIKQDTDWRLKNNASIPGRVQCIIFSKALRPAQGHTQSPIQWVPGSSLGGKAAGV